jgi:1-phosphatidylinositol-3-phosphate 5-kinase
MATTTESNVAGPRRQPPANEFTLTTFNPFPDEEELDQPSYTYVTSLFSKVRNTFASAPTSKSQATVSQPADDPPPKPVERKSTLPVVTKAPLPPLVSVTPAVSQAPSFQRELDSPVFKTGLFGFGGSDSAEGQFGTAIPGFPIADDARSIKTSTSYSRQKGVSKIIRRLRGEGTEFYNSV